MSRFFIFLLVIILLTNLSLAQELQENPNEIIAIDETISSQVQQTTENQETISVGENEDAKQRGEYLNDKLVAMKDGSGNKLYYHPDHLGSTTLVTNQSGDMVEEDVYLPFGGLYSGLGLGRFLFTNQELDKGTGFYDYGARLYYAPFMRFLQCDPVKSNIYDPQNLNCYSYVLNNPYKYTDPTGNFVDPVSDYLLISIAIGAGYGFLNAVGNEQATWVDVVDSTISGG